MLPFNRLRGSRESSQRGSNFDNVFYEGREDSNSTNSGPSLARMAFHWRADDGPTLNAGLHVAQL